MISVAQLLSRRYGGVWEWDQTNRTWWSSDGKHYVLRSIKTPMKSLELYKDNVFVTMFLVADLRRQYTHAYTTSEHMIT